MSKIIPALLIMFFLSGCMDPIVSSIPALTYAGYAKTGINLATTAATGKTIDDHLLSAYTGRDCSMFHLLTDSDEAIAGLQPSKVCHDEEGDEVPLPTAKVQSLSWAELEH